METIQFSETDYLTRYGEKLDLSKLTNEEKNCLKEAIQLHNQNTPYLAFIDWMLEQPEIQKFFNCGVWLDKEGKKSPLYLSCDDITLRLAKEQKPQIFIFSNAIN